MNTPSPKKAVSADEAAVPLNSFTASSEALSNILDRMRSDTLPLEESIALFEEGIQHLKNCQVKLATSKAKVEELVGQLQSDEPLSTVPFEG
jgi:exodeoxyribonuclease VII small subunit